jgi:hypothetical protein
MLPITCQIPWPAIFFLPDGTQKIVVYNNYEKVRLTLADLLTKTNDVWVSIYDYVRNVTDHAIRRWMGFRPYRELYNEQQRYQIS